MQIFCPSILLCFEQSYLLLNCITLYILFVFFEDFCFVCLHFHMLHLCFFCFFCFSPLCFCSVKLPEKQFYSMNIKPLLEDSINLFNYLQLLRLLYDHCVRACVCVCVCGVCVSVSLITGHPLLRKYASWYCQGLSKT